MDADAELSPWLARWDLALDGPPPARRYEGQTASGRVTFVRRGRTRLVLKLTPAEGDEANLAAVLAHWNADGAVALVASEPGAVLMERAVPGDELEHLLTAEGDAAATAVAAEVMARLRRPAPAGGPFRTIADWGEGFERLGARAVEAGFDDDLIAQARRTFEALLASQETPVLLHGDLHHENIVRDDRRGWLAIDPKGVLGEPAYETGALLRNPRDPAQCASSEIIERRAQALSARLGDPLDRVIGWCFAQWVLACLWALEDGIPFRQGWMTGPRAAAALI